MPSPSRDGRSLRSPIVQVCRREVEDRALHGVFVRLERSAVKLCAMSRTDGIVTPGDRSSRQLTPRRTTDLSLKGGGNRSMLVKRGMTEDVYDMALQRLSDTAKAGLLEPQCPGMERHTRR
jgi:hypothetical protein